MRDERGQALPITAVMVCVMLFAAVIAVHTAKEATVAAQIQTAADASALAGVTDGPDAAQSAAKVNGADLVSIDRHGDTAEVLVRQGEREARAKAQASSGLAGATTR